MRSRIEISERQSRAALFAATTAVLILVLAAVLFAAEPDARGHLGTTPSGGKTATISTPPTAAPQDMVAVSAPPAALWHVLFAN